MNAGTTILSKSAKREIEQISTWHIHLQGLVQGVGFRPYVYQLATGQQLNGAVSNGLDGLHIWLNTDYQTAQTFLQKILHAPPPLSKITGHSLNKITHQHFNYFEIIAAPENTAPNLWITPDLAICPSCKKELHDPQNRRYHYPFITCTQCGPRYSIMENLPFERHFTTMRHFEMCSACKQEYDNPENERFYAQTTSCNTCGVVMELYQANGLRIDATQEQIIQQAAKALLNGNIVAVKGIGGFLLMADASHAEAIEKLRSRKHRPSKPFAVLYPSWNTLEEDGQITPAQKQAICSIEAPVVLVNITRAMRTKLATEQLAPGLDKIGIMLPYAPLLELLVHETGRPLVATSGNVSGSPIFFTNQEAMEGLAGISDYILLHTRDIMAPQDDSVMAFSDFTQTPIFLRRSRGWAPAFPGYKALTNKTILATGALLKSSFTLAHQHQVYISQYLGNTDGFEAQQAYRHTLAHLQGLIQATPQIIVTDHHPQYFSHELGHELAEQYNIPLITAQHHKAHFAAILAEHNLLKTEKLILGIIWDGTGLGDDGNSWGGEFFVFDRGKVSRPYHMAYFPYLLGDKMAREPRLSAISFLYANPSAGNEAKQFFNEQEWELYQKMLGNFDGIFTSSVGRMFDAVACLLTGLGKQSYEGEAAMRLEAMARQWFIQNGALPYDTCCWESPKSCSISLEGIFKRVMDDFAYGKDHGEIAFFFHEALVELILLVAEELNIEQLAFSGGVWQNSLLVDRVKAKAPKEIDLYFHQQLSPNDENISFGQLVWYDNNLI